MASKKRSAEEGEGSDLAAATVAAATVAAATVAASTSASTSASVSASASAPVNKKPKVINIDPDTSLVLHATELNVGTSSKTVHKKPKVIDPDKVLSLYAQRFIVGTYSLTGVHDRSICIKLYFKKKLMAWEFLGEDKVMKKMQIPFANIVVFHIVQRGANEATVRFKLKAPPRFFRDMNEGWRDGRAAEWLDCNDFTVGCQAIVYSEYTFIMDKVNKAKAFYDKILAADSVLKSLIKWFPIHKASASAGLQIGQSVANRNVNTQQQQQHQQQQQQDRNCQRVPKTTTESGKTYYDFLGLGPKM